MVDNVVPIDPLNVSPQTKLPGFSAVFHSQRSDDEPRRICTGEVTRL